MEKIYRKHNYVLLLLCWLFTQNLLAQCTTVNITFSGDNPDELRVCIEDNPINLVPFASPPGGIFSGIGVASNNFIPLSAGVGTFEVTYTLGTESCTKNIVVSPISIDLPLDIQFYCAGYGPIDLREYASPPGGFFTGPAIENDYFFNPNVSGGGEHSFTYVLGPDSCTTTIDVTPILFQAVIDTMPLTFCTNSSPYQLRGNGTIEANGGFYLDTAEPPSPVLPGAMYEPRQEGIDSIIYAYVDFANGGCPVFDTTVVTVVDIEGITPDEMFENTAKVFCKNDNNLVELIATPEGGTFYSDDGAIITDGFLDVTNTPLGDYTLKYEFGEVGSGDCLNALAISIVDLSNFQLDFDLVPSQCENLPDELVYTGDPLPEGVSLNWEINGAELMEEQATSAKVQWAFPGEYSVTLQLLGTNCFEGGGVSKQQVARTDDNCFSTVFIPNIFTPNGDGKNDEFYVMGKNVTVNQLIVYDRWGEKVFESTDGTAWDGTFRDQDLNTAVFYYYAEVETVEGVQTHQGNVTLIR